ncbi:hypothetical protein [Enhygromyxa salina]|uniref:hypothetical protein n=1 Tax=Enhygromyxa salina TaxID=215803 RepID=UPI0011BA6C3E|nr:hypothetical protein [Enhygromyxa salina]
MILDLSLNAFERSRETRVRPEGTDDLEIEHHLENLVVEHEHVQVKKPRQTATGARDAKAWRLLQVCDELLGPSLDRLHGNSNRQTWVLGDAFDDATEKLMEAGASAAIQAPAPYSKALYRLARTRSQALRGMKTHYRKRFVEWSPAPPPTGADHPAYLRSAIEDAASELGLDQARLARIVLEIDFVHSELLGVLERTKSLTCYGEIDAIREKVATRIASRFNIDEQVARRTVLNNFRGFLDDIARQRTRWIDYSDFELELLRVLPHTIPFSSPPPLPPLHVPRPQLIEAWMNSAVSITNVVASSGAGKSTAARELAATLARSLPKDAVLYAEIREENDIRGFLVGLAFKLRRRGHNNLFAVATRLDQSEQTLVESFADALLSTPEPIHLIVDFVIGASNQAFHASLADLMRRLWGRGLRTYLFARRDPLEELNQLERAGLRLQRADLHGLHEAELLELGKLHGHGDAKALRVLHSRLSGGRYTGVLPRDAVALLRLPSTDAMLALIEASEVASIAETADRHRYQMLPTHLREAAAHVLCFSLPFSETDVQLAFPELPVSATLLRLRELGLLLEHHAGTFEFHERVRAGLLNEAPPRLVQRAHSRLAELAISTESHAIAVYHLEQAEQSEQARTYARTVLFGTSRSGLVDYARTHQLFEPGELLPHASPGSEKSWTALELLKDVGDDHIAEHLVEMMRGADPRKHYMWLSSAYETILCISPSSFESLFDHAIAPALESPVNPCPDILLRAARRAGYEPPTTLDARYDSDPEHRLQLLRFLTLAATPRRIRYFIDSVQSGQAPESDFFTHEHARRLFIANLPKPDLSELVAKRDTKLGPFGPVLWRHRVHMRQTAHELLETAGTDVNTLRSALRLLIYYGDEDIAQYRDRFDDVTDSYARLGPVLVGDHSVLSDERERVLDEALSPKTRMFALSICGLANDAEIEDIVDQLRARGTKDASGLIQMLSVMGAMLPLGLLVQVTAHVLDTDSEERPRQTTVTALAARLAERRVPSDSPAMDIMLRLLEHEHPHMRLSACIGLRRQRTRRALPSLINRLNEEHDLGLHGVLMSTFLASYPTEAPEIRWMGDTDYWRAAVADRLQITSELPWLSALATDRTAAWHARRAAIAALMRLSDADAFEAVAERILGEPMILGMDDGHGSATEFFLSLLMREREHDQFESTGHRFMRSRPAFAAFFGPLYQELAQPVAAFRLNEIGLAVAETLWDYVHPVNETVGERLDKLINELGTTMVQAAAMQGLRQHARPRLLEMMARTTAFPWLAVRACVERRRCSPAPEEAWLEAARARSFDVDPQAEHAIRNILCGLSAEPKTPPPTRRTHSPAVVTPSFTPRRYSIDVLVDALERGDDLPAAACVIGPPTGRETAEFEQLITLLHPGNDRVVRFDAASSDALAPAFDGNRLRIHGVRSHTVADRRPWRTWLRVALVVANDAGIEIPWLTTSEDDSAYGQMLTECLLARRDGRRIAAVLERSVNYFEQGLRNKDFIYELAPILDSSVVPLIERYLWRGPPQHLTGLIRLASKLDFPEIVPALETMLQRVTDVIAPMGQSHSGVNDDDPALMSLSALLKAPRLPEIEAAPGLLGRLRQVLRHSWMLTSVIRAMERVPHSYVDLEMERMTVLNFRHMHIDEFRLVDCAAARLFELGRPEPIESAQELDVQSESSR